MTEKTTTIPVSGSPGRFKTPQRPGQSGERDERRPGPNPLSEHPTGPHAPYDQGDSEGTAAIKHDAEGQYAKSQARPNAGGLASANPVVLSDAGEASPEGGHGRERKDGDDWR